MNTSSSNIRVKKAPHWKKGAPLMKVSFSLTDEERKTLHMSSMRMRGFSHKYERDIETNITNVFSKNPKKVTADIRALFPDLDVNVKRVFIPYGAYA